MTSSTSCSSRAAKLATLLVAAAGLACAGGPGKAVRGPAGELTRVAVLPPDNLSSGAVPVRDLRAATELALARRGVEVVTGDLVERFLAHYRLRYTGGIDPAAARAAGEEMGVNAVVITSVEQYAAGGAPRLAITMRLVAATEQATLLWIDGVSRAGDEAPGVLGLGIVTDFPSLERKVLTRLADSMGRFLEGRGPAAPPCPDGRRFRPKVPYRSALLDPKQTYSVAVVPFRNLTARRGAGDVVALTFARQMAAVPNFKIIEPGAVRDILLRFRIVMEGGVSVDQVRSLLGALGADLVVTGDVLEYGAGGVPSLNFTATILEGRSGRIAWQSTSYNRGDDGVFFFDAGMISTPSALACRMVRSAVDGMLTAKVTPTPALPSPGPEAPRR
jgi:TolB-like protein